MITYTKAKLKKLLEAQNFSAECTIHLNDRSYVVLDADWLKKEAYPAYHKWLSFAGVTKWRTNWDCDNFSQTFKTFLNILHARENSLAFKETFGTDNKNATDAEAVAVGVMCYNNSARSSHANNMVIGNNDEILFFEPDGGDYLNLSKKQKESIWYLNF